MSQNQIKPEEVDELSKMVFADIPADIKRLKQMDASTEALHTELASTVMYYLKKLGEQALGLRNWSYQCVQGLGEHISEVEAMASGAAGEQTQITEDDADKLMRVITAAMTLAEELLKSQQTEEGRKKLEEIVQLAKDCESIVSDNVLVSDDDDEDEDDEGDESDSDDSSSTSSEEVQ